MSEQLIASISPHLCILCAEEGDLLCKSCMDTAFLGVDSRCYNCNRPTIDAKTCLECRRKTPLGHVWVGGEYGGALERVIYDFKFERARAAAKPLANGLRQCLPFLEDVIIVPIPTAPKRVRVRGYDQTWLLARELGLLLGQPVSPALARQHNLRQVGANRQKRFQQAATAFRLKTNLHEKHVLLVDDVVTSGATLTAAAKLLRASGVRQIDAAVVARQA